VSGHASISILFFEIDVDVPEITWGSASVPAASPRDPLTELVKQLKRPEAWSAAATPVPQVVQLRPESAGGAVAVHPLARMSVRQEAVPLDTPLQRMDGIRLPAPVVLQVRPLPVPPPGEGPGAVLRAPFVPSRFFELDAAAQLSAAGVADLPAGIELPTAPTTSPAHTTREWKYERKVLARSRRGQPARSLADVLVASALPRAVTAVSVGPLVQVREPHAVLATTGRLAEATAQVATALTGAGGTAALLGERLSGTSVAGSTSRVEAQLAAQALAGLGAAVPVQLVSAWEVAP
jgi:hypothetical protein